MPLVGIDPISFISECIIPASMQLMLPSYVTPVDLQESPLRAVEMDLREVSDAIKRVEMEIQDVGTSLKKLEKEISEAKKANDKEELSYLREKENQLLDNKNKLLDNKNKLLDKENKLLDDKKQLRDEKSKLLDRRNAMNQAPGKYVGLQRHGIV